LFFARSADGVCRGSYPWEQGAGSIAAAPPAATREQLITQLRTPSSELARANEELDLLQAERAQCLGFLERERLGIQAAITNTHERVLALQNDSDPPICSSFGSRQPTCAAVRQTEQLHCDGLLLLLGDCLTHCCQQLDAARTAFDAADWDAAACVLADDCQDEEVPM
jgi:hypothetical protein